MLSGLTIGGLFALTRRAARDARLEELRQDTLRDMRIVEERLSQERNLARTRGITSAQLSSVLMERGVSPMMLLGGVSPDSPAAAASIVQAASTKERG
jgi:hypothetical protein